jgi:hypothetical protein
MITITELQKITAEAISWAQRQLAEKNEQIFRAAMQQLKTGLDAVQCGHEP